MCMNTLSHGYYAISEESFYFIVAFPSQILSKRVYQCLSVFIDTFLFGGFFPRGIFLSHVFLMYLHSILNVFVAELHKLV